MINVLVSKRRNKTIGILGHPLYKRLRVFYNRLGLCRVIEVGGVGEWKTILSPFIGKAWCWPGMVYIDISAARQSKKHQQTEPCWVGLSVQYLWQDKRPNGMTRGVFPDTLCYLIKSPGKRWLTIRACTWRLVKVNICCFVLLNFDKVIKTRVKVCHTFLLIYI